MRSSFESLTLSLAGFAKSHLKCLKDLIVKGRGESWRFAFGICKVLRALRELGRPVANLELLRDKSCRTKEEYPCDLWNSGAVEKVSSSWGIGSRQTGHGTSISGSFPFCENPVKYALMHDSQNICEHGKVLGLFNPSSHKGQTSSRFLPESVKREEDIGNTGYNYIKSMGKSNENFKVRILVCRWF